MVAEYESAADVLPPLTDPVAGETGTIAYPLLPPAALAARVIATVYVAPAAGVSVLGAAVVEPPALWQTAQSDPLVGCAIAAWVPTVAARTAAAKPVASTKIFGRLIVLSLLIII
jgi:hypothetical protein